MPIATTRVDTDLVELLDATTTAVRSAAHVMADLFGQPPPTTDAGIVAAIAENDAISLSVLRPMLERARPDAGWVEDELEDGALPPGEWWVTDPVEGNVNHVHGLTDWGVTATLVRDNAAILTVIHLPLVDSTYTSIQGAGAFQDGVALRVSSKTELRGALVGTGQASPRETAETFALIGTSVPAMLEAALVLRVSVPATLQLVDVAAGRMDAFWQHSAVRSGLLAGALLVSEAGGILTDLRGQPWSLDSRDFLAAAPGVHVAALHVLASTGDRSRPFDTDLAATT